MENGKIYSALSAVMAEIGHIGKDKRNQQQGFMYRGIDDVMNALQPALVQHKVVVVPEVLEQTREERLSKSGGNLIYSICKIRFTFYADDGSFVQAVTVGEGMDSGDRATNKAMAIALKYAAFQVFCIPTEEMPDPDAETPPPSEKKQHAKAPGEHIAPADADKIYLTMNEKGYEDRETNFFFYKKFGCKSLRELSIENLAEAKELAAIAKLKEAS